MSGTGVVVPRSMEPALRGGVQVATMRVAALERLTRDAQALLTVPEREAVSRFRNPRRRRESVAGRLVAKWLFLRQVASLADGQGEEVWPRETWAVTPGALDAVPQHDYQSVEILPGDGGAPCLTSRRGPSAEMRVSIAHGGGLVVAAMSRSIPIGVDIEAVAPRRPSFYDECFSDRERAWLRGASTAHTERLATLLWTVKEACFKTGASMASTVWGIGAIDLDISTPAAQAASALAAGEPTRLEALALDVAVRDAGLRPRVAYGARGTLALAVMGLVPRA